MNSKMTAKQTSAIETKRKIFENAKWLFTKYGFDKVSVDSIVERAGVAKGSFYVHFKSKNTLIMEFLKDYLSSIDADYRSFYESFSYSSKSCDILTSFVDKIIDIIVNEIGYNSIRLVYEVQVTKKIDNTPFLDDNRDLYRIFTLIINRGIEQKEFKTIIPVDQLVRHFVIILRGYIYEWCVRYPEFDIKTETRKHFQILLEGLKY